MTITRSGTNSATLKETTSVLVTTGLPPTASYHERTEPAIESHSEDGVPASNDNMPGGKNNNPVGKNTVRVGKENMPAGKHELSPGEDIRMPQDKLMVDEELLAAELALEAVELREEAGELSREASELRKEAEELSRVAVEVLVETVEVEELAVGERRAKGAEEEHGFEAESRNRDKEKFNRGDSERDYRSEEQMGTKPDSPVQKEPDGLESERSKEDVYPRNPSCGGIPISAMQPACLDELYTNLRCPGDGFVGDWEEGDQCSSLNTECESTGDVLTCCETVYCYGLVKGVFSSNSN